MLQLIVHQVQESFSERSRVVVSERPEPAGSAGFVVVSGAVLLRPDAQLFEAMLESWSRQRTARQLAETAVIM